LHVAIIEHFCRAQVEQETHSAESQGFLRLWSEAKVRPLSKSLFRRVSSTDNVSYHIPAAASLEIQFATRMAVSSALKVQPVALALHFEPSVPLKGT
jgi:hypothetical protein